MKYMLMHKDVAVLEFSFSEQRRWARIIDVLNAAHVPVNMLVQPHNRERALNEFIDHRFIPQSRSNYDVIKALYKAKDAFELSMRSYMVSISDHYWVKPCDSSVTWSDVNFYDNPIPDDQVLIGAIDTLHQYDPWRRTPNTSNNGTLRQIWLHRGDEILLSKAGELTFKQEPFNEAVVSDILAYFDVPYITYYLDYMSDEAENVSVCNCFTNRTVEYIPAWQLTANTKPNDVSEYEHYVNQLHSFGLTDVTSQLEQMIVLDALIANEDRHWGNFGALRNSESLEFIGLAPVFDNGNSLGYKAASVMRNRNADVSVAFNKTHTLELKHVSSTVKVDWDGIMNHCMEIVEHRYNQLVEPEFGIDRAHMIGQFIQERAKKLKTF